MGGGGWVAFNYGMHAIDGRIIRHLSYIAMYDHGVLLLLKCQLKLIMHFFSSLGNNSHTYAQTVMRDASTMEAAKITAISKSKSAIISAMRNTFFAAYYNLANTIVPKLHQLCITQVWRILYYSLLTVIFYGFK